MFQQPRWNVYNPLLGRGDVGAREELLSGLTEDGGATRSAKECTVLLADGSTSVHKTITLRAKYSTPEGLPVTEVNSFSYKQKMESDDESESEGEDDEDRPQSGGCCQAGRLRGRALRGAGGSIEDFRAGILAQLVEVNPVVKSTKEWGAKKGNVIQREYKQTRLATTYESNDGQWEVMERDVFTIRIV
jgi:hypothetical protein